MIIFLAIKISFINAMSSMCAATGADVTVLADAIGRDERIGGQFLRAGIGFGGGCLPKDLRGLRERAAKLSDPNKEHIFYAIDVFVPQKHTLLSF